MENMSSAYVYVKPSVKNKTILNQSKLEIEGRRECMCAHTDSRVIMYSFSSKMWLQAHDSKCSLNYCARCHTVLVVTLQNKDDLG